MDVINKNVLGTPLEPCCLEVRSGFFRDGYCRTGDLDLGKHVVCAVVTKGFLVYSLTRGNDLITPRPDWDFPGLKPGDKWCLCATRWKEAFEAGCAPPVVLESCHESATDIIDLDVLKAHV